MPFHLHDWAAATATEAHGSGGAVAEMNRRGGAGPSRGAARLDFNGFTNWQEDCTSQICKRTVAAMRHKPSNGNQSGQVIRPALVGSRLSWPGEKSIKTTSAQSLLRFGTCSIWSSGPGFRTGAPGLSGAGRDNELTAPHAGRAVACTPRGTAYVSGRRVNSFSGGESHCGQARIESRDY